MQLIRTALLLYFFLSGSATQAGEIILNMGPQTVHAEIADTERSREHGLMRREHLCANCGMLFVFDKPGKYNFWMKDTPLPLSIAFIAADGGILNIEEMQPDTTDFHTAQSAAAYALEMNGGWFAKHGIHPADQVQGLPPVPGSH